MKAMPSTVNTNWLSHCLVLARTLRVVTLSARVLWCRLISAAKQHHRGRSVFQYNSFKSTALLQFILLLLLRAKVTVLSHVQFCNQNRAVLY